MKDLLTKLITLLLDGSSDFSVDETIKDNSHNLKINCTPDNIGRIIGKGGHTIRSLRTLLSIKGFTAGKQVLITLSEPTS